MNLYKKLKLDIELCKSCPGFMQRPLVLLKEFEKKVEKGKEQITNSVINNFAKKEIARLRAKKRRVKKDSTKSQIDFDIRIMKLYTGGSVNR